MGVLLIMISSLCFVLSSYFGKIVTNTTEMTAIVTSFSRFLIGAIVMGLYIIFSKKSFKAGNIKPIIIRAVFNSLAVILLSWGLQYTTITNNNMLNMTYPVFVILFTPLITKEKIKKSTYIYLTLIMIGSYIVADPSFSKVNIGDIISLASALVAAFAIIALSESSKSNEGYIIVFYVMLIGTFINIPVAYNDLVNFDINGLVPVFLAGFMGVLGQVFLTWGYKYVDSATGSLVASSRIIMSATIGALFLGEPTNIRIIVGVSLITLSLVGVSGFFGHKSRTNIVKE